MSETIHKPDPADGLRFGRVTPGRRDEALGLLLSGRASARESVVQPFVDYATQHQLALDELWVAQAGEVLQAAVLIVPCPGRSGMLFCSPAASWCDAAQVVELLRRACEAQRTEGMQLIQCLLDPPQRELAETLSAAGFWELATLKYMQRRIDRRPSAQPLDERFPDLQVMSWTEERQPAFARAIRASYEQTRDCPGLRGVRHIDDVIAGHQAAGVFCPDLWHVVYDGDEPVGVMLINEVSQLNACELVYFGLSVAYRGRGLGRRLIEAGLDLAHTRRRATMMLAVDTRNEPALRLYRDAGFRETACKRAMVFT